MKKTILFLGLLCLVMALHGQEMPVDAAVRIGKLSNGLTYYIRHNALPAERADFYIAQKVGSIVEEDDQRGLAHFLEHMCFNGTTHFPGKSMINYLETIGVKFGQNLNAYTSIDETVYNINNVPVTRLGAVDSCLLILRDWADGLLLEPAEIDNERGVIHEEWRTRMSATQRMLERILPTLYKGSQYAYRMPIGTMDVIDNFEYQALRDYYEKWYRPDLQGIIVVGDIDVDDVETKIKALFSDIEIPANAAERIYYPVADNHDPIVAIDKDKEQVMPLVYLFYKHDATPDAIKQSKAYFVTDYMKTMIEQMMEMRLEELRQQATPPFVGSDIADDDFLLAKTKSAFIALAASSEDGITTALAALVREVERMRRYGFTASEYERARAKFLTHIENAYNERDKVKNNTYVNECVRHFLDNEPMPGIEFEYATFNQLAPAIAVEYINQLIPQLVSDENNAIVLFCPDKEGVAIPTEAEVLETVARVKGEEITPYEDVVSDEPLISTLPQAGEIVSCTDGPFDSKVYTLTNGARVVMKETDFKADQVMMYAFSKGGTSQFEDADIDNFAQMSTIAAVGGWGTFSKTELTKALAGKNARTAITLSNSYEGVNGTCAPKDFETMMQLTYLNFTAPRIDEEAFKSHINRTRASLSNVEANPRIALTDSINAALYMNHPRTVRFKAAQVDNIDYHRVIDLYKERFADASDFTFLFVGNVNDDMLPLIAQYIGALPSTYSHEEVIDRHKVYRSGEYTNVFAKPLETPKATIFIAQTGEMPYTLENNIKFSALRQILNIMYTASVREQEGGTYGVSVSGITHKIPNETVCLTINFESAPDRHEALTAIVLQELEQVAEVGPALDDLNKVKEYMLKHHSEEVKENSYWASALVDYYFEDYDGATDYATLVESLTVESIRNYTATLLAQRNRTKVVMTGE